MKIKLFLCALILAASQIIYADDVTDSINEALKSYESGDLSSAAGSLDYAAQLIRQKKADDIKSYFPKALEGWTEEEPSSEAMGNTIFGGGISSEKRYSKDSASVTISIITDSPMMQGVIMMFTNPMLATSGGGKIEKIKDQKAIIKYNTSSKDGEITMVVANRFMITVKANEASLEEMKNYASNIDFAKITASK